MPSDDAASCWADPTNWSLGGQVYCCAEDPRVWVPKPSAPALHAAWLRFAVASAAVATAGGVAGGSGSEEDSLLPVRIARLQKLQDENLLIRNLLQEDKKRVFSECLIPDIFVPSLSWQLDRFC
eukprot:COSAG06_NODE_3330_length_5494_cov_6.154402_4_plen_124_part_00